MKDTEVFQLDHSLVLKPNHLRRVYGVTILMDQDGKDKQHIRFEMEVLVQKNKASKSWLYQFNRRNLFINRKMPTGIAEKLAFECGQVMYPLQIEVSGDASKKIIKSRATAIAQLNVLEEKTNNTQKSTIVDTYFKKAWDTVNNSSKFGKAVEQNLFLSFFFAPIYGRYNVLSNRMQDTMDIPMIPFCSSVRYDVEQKVNSEYTPFNTITVLQEGKISDQRTEKDFLHRLDSPVFVGKGQSKKTGGQLTAKYELDIDTRVIQSINAKISIELPENQGRSFEFQAYYLPERNKHIKNRTIVDQPLKKDQDEQ